MILIGQILLIAINVSMAWYHVKLMKAEKKIYHGLWGAAYLTLAGLFSWLNHSWTLFVLSLLIRKVFFDLSLNVFRFGWKRWSYVTPEVKNVTGLWDAIRKGKTIDWIHYKIFGFTAKWYMIIYSVLIIVINFFV